MIRPCRAEDVETIRDIADRAWQPIYDMFEETYGEELFPILVTNRDTSKSEQIQSHWERAPEWILICEEEGAIVGFVTFRIDESAGVGEIGNNAVDPNCGLKGIGQQLYAAALECFRKHGLKAAKVGTGLDWAHAPARRAYERAGFDVKHETVTYFKKL
ncbi:MAG: GNAT family N-acetyltransferase [Gemmatimonadetes bacterium]|jgi:ribosomal protein S18 acetylase RimI-like enzyme|nr:GNAT family N-acetyltransferase [Gemmatimonadota bacterium]MBT6148063.1 GNAT family N-acetyltransferase [Gemmatimonadota bacterium]MBT7861902.1 GNAT family N-acetyltransferase [Gemmatimonadota bacterium]